MNILRYDEYNKLTELNGRGRPTPMLLVKRTKENMDRMHHSISILYTFILKLQYYVSTIGDKGSTHANYLRRYIQLYNILVLNYQDTTNDLLDVFVESNTAQYFARSPFKFPMHN